MVNWKEDFLHYRKNLYYTLLNNRFREIIDSNNRKIYYEYIPSKLELSFLESIAQEKMKYTNSNNQDDQIRIADEKVNKQFEGCLAEFVVAKFLITILDENPQNIKIYDAEREDFLYHKDEEYDIKVCRNSITKKCEVRCSWSYRYDLTKFCKDCDVIGSYINNTKYKEALADFYIRPVLQLKQFDNKLSHTPKNSIQLMKEGKAGIYIVAACTREEMEKLGTLNPAMTRNQTKFFCTKINQLDSVSDFKKKYHNMFN